MRVIQLIICALSFLTHSQVIDYKEFIFILVVYLSIAKNTNEQAIALISNILYKYTCQSVLMPEGIMSSSTSPFLEMVRGEIRLRGYSLRTEKSYLFWIKQFILFHQKRHPATMGNDEVKQFLTWLAVRRHVAVNTQKVALNALVFLYHKVLKQELGELGFSLATKQRHLPSVLTPTEVAMIFQHLHDRDRLIVELLYQTVHNMISFTGLNAKSMCLEILLNYLERFRHLIGVLGLRCVNPEEVLERGGLASKTMRRMMKYFYPVEFFRQDGIGYCPGCLHDKQYLRKIWMFRPYSICHIHGSPIRTTCTSCNEEMKIFRGILCECSHCKSDIREALPVRTNTQGSWVYNFIHQGNDAGSEEFTTLFSWAKQIRGENQDVKTDSDAASLV